MFDKKGDILTDEHVVSGASSITVNFPDGTKAPATVVGSDTGADMAVIRVQGVPPPSFTRSRSATRARSRWATA